MGQGWLGVLYLDASVLEHSIGRIPCCYHCSLWYYPRSFSHQIMVTEVDMKPDIHPEYREVLFHDTSSDTYFVIGSTVETNDTRDYMANLPPTCLWIFLAPRIRSTRASKRSLRAMDALRGLTSGLAIGLKS